MNLIPLVAIGVSRNGESVRPPIGKPFDFTEEEQADLDRQQELHSIEVYRLPVNEDAGEVAQVATGKKGAKKSVVVAGGEGL